MKKFALFLTSLQLLGFLAGCATTRQVNPGDTETQVIAARGTPTHRYQLGQEQLLEYNQGPSGRQTFMARIGADGKLVSFEQVLTTEKFALIEIGKTTKNQVRHLIGTPSEQSFLRLPELEVWSYPYKESGIWPATMHVHFDKAGTVRKLVNTRDQRFNALYGHSFSVFGK